MAVGGRSPEPVTELLMEGRWTRVWVSVRSVAATDGAIVEAIDRVLLLSPPLEDAMLVVLVCTPGTPPVYPFAGCGVG